MNKSGLSQKEMRMQFGCCAPQMVAATERGDGSIRKRNAQQRFDGSFRKLKTENRKLKTKN